MNVEIKSTIDGVRAQFKALPGEMVDANIRALNKVAKSARAVVVKKVRPGYPGVKVRELNSRLLIERAHHGSMQVALTMTGKRFVLYGKFGMKPVGDWGVMFTKMPYKVETVEGNAVSDEMLARAFRQRSGRTGRPDVFARETKARSSMTLLLVPGLNRSFRDLNADRVLKDTFRIRYPIVLRQEVNFLVGKRQTMTFI